MYRHSIWIGVAVVAVWGLPTPTAADEGTRLTLGEALELARSRSPALASSRELPEEARGVLIGAEILLRDNPELEAAAGPRTAVNANEPGTTDYEVGLEQRFEIGGQRRHRIGLAAANVSAAEARLEETMRLLDLAIAETFYESLAARETLRLFEEAHRLARSLEDMAQRRVEAGEGTPLELNTARIRRAESSRLVARTTVSWQLATVRLAELIGLPPARPLEPQGSLPTGAIGVAREELLSRASTARPDLLAALSDVDAARAGVALAEAERLPDVAFGLSASREEEQDVLLAHVRIPLSLFDRNQGERQRSKATARRHEADLDQQRLAVEGDIRRALQAYDASLAARRIYDEEIVAAQTESLELLELAFEAGEVGYAEVLVVQRELLDGRLGRLEAELALARSTARLLAAAHLPQTYAKAGGDS